MAFYVGDLLVERFSVVDTHGAPIPGLSFAVTGIGPLGPFPNAMVNERNPGYYEVRYQTSEAVDIPGVYTVHIVANDPWSQAFDVTWDVDATSSQPRVIFSNRVVPPHPADPDGTHDSRYYTESEVDSRISSSTVATVADATFRIQDDLDNTKQVQFQVGNVSPGTTRTLTVPNTSGTLVTMGATQTLTNKTLTAPAITSPTGLTKSDVGLGNVPNVDATSRSAHIGTQLASSISDFSTAAATAATPTIGNFPVVGNRWHGPLAHPHGAVSDVSSSAVMATVANRHARYAPFFISNTCTINQVRTAIAAAAAGGLVNLSIYKASNVLLTNVTNGLVVNLGNVDGTTIGDKVITLATNVSLTGPAWYLAMALGEATAEGLQIAGRNGLVGVYGTDASGFPAGGRFTPSGITSIVPPATWGYSVGELATFLPRIEFRIVP